MYPPFRKRTENTHFMNSNYVNNVIKRPLDVLDDINAIFLASG